MRTINRPEIDCLRAIVVGAVILYHATITILGYQPFKDVFLIWAYWKTTLILL